MENNNSYKFVFFTLTYMYFISQNYQNIFNNKFFLERNQNNQE